MPAATHRFQAPKGTRDFLPAAMAVRRHLESEWRAVATAHGFDEIEGPTFEHLELYTVKSGPGIVSELFSFRRADGDTDYALRPEFTPTLARLVAANANALAKPTKWFTIGPMFRAERPQRGRLREHIQWNVDLVGDDSASADAEIIATAAACLERFGLGPDQVQFKLNDRYAISRLLAAAGVDEASMPGALALLDRRDKLPEDAFRQQAADLGFDDDGLARFLEVSRVRLDLGAEAQADDWLRAHFVEGGEEVERLRGELTARGLADWCHWDLGIVRGLAYYTGTVFEIHETTGRERAIAGGGRYDELVALFGGPATPAVGFAMGDVVIRLVLEERGLLEAAEEYLPRPDVFVIDGCGARETMLDLVGRLRRGGLHVRHSYRATKNVGKLLGDANKARSRFAVILGRELDDGRVVVRDLDAGSQDEVALDEITAERFA